MIFEARYLNRWVSSISNEELYNTTLRIWDNDLKNFSNEVIKLALDCLSKEHPAWPPVIGEFTAICSRLKGDSRLPWAHEISAELDAPKKQSNQDISTARIIDEGAITCKTLKNLYPDLNWMQIADLFTKVKKSPESIIRD